MKERPILFSAPMVRAILEGRKTQTRRIIKGVPSYMHYGRDIMDWSLSGIHQDEYLKHNQLQASDMWYLDVQTDVDDHSRKLIRCPYGQPGDRLWVREAHAIVPRTAYAMSDGVQQTLRPDDDHDAAIYREGWERSTGGFRWRPSIHMPRWASRILLEVVSVRAERLQDISEEDCVAEGCAGGHWSIPGYYYSATPREHYRWLWESINGPESWAAIPWVWVVEFRRVQP